MLTTRIELVTSSLPMRCATDCAMSAYLLKLIVSLLTINFKSQTNTQCLSSITIILPSHKMHRFTINIQSESVRQIFHICTSLHMKCAEPDKHAVFVVRYRYILHLQHEVFIVHYRYLPSHKMQRKAHRFTINIQSESLRQIFHICLALHTSCAELF